MASKVPRAMVYQFQWLLPRMSLSVYIPVLLPPSVPKSTWSGKCTPISSRVDGEKSPSISIGLSLLNPLDGITELNVIIVYQIMTHHILLSNVALAASYVVCLKLLPPSKIIRCVDRCVVCLQRSTWSVFFISLHRGYHERYRPVRTSDMVNCHRH